MFFQVVLHEFLSCKCTKLLRTYNTEEFVPYIRNILFSIFLGMPEVHGVTFVLVKWVDYWVIDFFSVLCLRVIKFN